MPSIKPVNSQTHKQTCVRKDNTFVPAKGQHLIPLFISEYEVASGEFPIVFVKDHETGQIKSAVMTGLKPCENLFYSGSDWRAEYIPISLRVSPFMAVASSTDEKNMLVCIDEDSALVNEKEGDALFAENGDETDYLKARGQFAAQVIEHGRLTDQFIRLLTDLKLLRSNNLNVKISDKENYELAGLYIIDRDRLQQLSDKEFLSLREAGYLPAIFASLSSVSKVNSLLRMKQAAEI